MEMGTIIIEYYYEDGMSEYLQSIKEVPETE